MRFERNDCLEYEEKIKLVAKEIMDKYKYISEEEAEKVAGLASDIEYNPTPDDKMDRYYYILRIIGRDHIEFANVFNDLYKLYEEGFEKEENITNMNNIIKYIETPGSKFPIFIYGLD